MSFDPTQFNVEKISQQSQSAFVYPNDLIPVARWDDVAQDYTNFAVPAAILGALPPGFVMGLAPSFIQTGTSITSINVASGYARDSSNQVNMMTSGNTTASGGSGAWIGPRPTGTDNVCYIILAFVSAASPTPAVFLSQNKAPTINGYQYVAAVGQGLYSYDGTNESVRNVWGYDNKIIAVQDNELTAGVSPLENGKIVLVLEPLT